MSNSFFKVLRPGINTTYQDEGRFGLQHFGIPLADVWIIGIFFTCKYLVGNKKNCGVLEFAYQGPLLKIN